ncbi:MAG: hypothetical protein Q4D87_08205 [Actinomycetaceae bacterium]|nr:hypothetical protein [Actinomycetaceae bacterium]
MIYFLVTSKIAAALSARRWFGFEPPLTPSPDEGRELLRRELLKGEYQEKRNWFEEFLLWLVQPLNDWIGDGGEIPTRPIIIVLIIAIVAVGSWIIYTRFLRGGGSPEIVVGDALLDPSIPPEEYRQRAIQMREGDPSEAVKAAFRAIVARLDRSGLTSTAPGRTVGDVTRTIGAKYPDLAQLAHVCGQSFDVAAYALIPNGRVDTVDVDQVLYLDDQVIDRLQRRPVKA